VDHRRIDVVDALAIAGQNRIGAFGGCAHVLVGFRLWGGKCLALPLPRNLRLAKPCPTRQAGSDDCTLHTLPRKVEPSLAPLMALVADGMNSVNAVILDRMQSRIR
jgi:hypothetical protein